MAKMILSLLVLAALGCFMTQPASAMYHIVGGSLGWTIPPNKTYFQEWAKPRVFGVEDKMLFPYRMGLHNIVEVGKEDFDACTQKKVIDIFYKGPTIINYTQPGVHYYYSGIGTQCEAGQKLSVTVVGGKGASGRRNLLEVMAPAPAPKSAASPIAGGLGMLSCLLPFLFSLFF
uniref:Putative umecyanin-like n=1 Tax=Davidia involucrata TaxID=16924 RepID=A0A5B7BTR6_DAVIN